MSGSGLPSAGRACLRRGPRKSNNCAGCRDQKDGLEPVLKALSDLFALDLLERKGYAAMLVVSGWATKAQLRLLSTAARGLLARLRPEAVALVDAFKFDDMELMQTAIGAQDGNVYERLWSWTEKDPLNQYPENVVAGYAEHLKPLLKGGSAAGPGSAGLLSDIARSRL